MEDLLTRNFVRRLIREAIPLGHFECNNEEAAERGDLGLGFIYYSLSRILRPSNIIVIGSYRGFSVICFALGLAHNGGGQVHFIDSSQVDDFWTHRRRVDKHFAKFGVTKYIHLYNESSSESFRKFAAANGAKPFIDILFIDGDHSFKGVSFDYSKFRTLVRNGGFILLHDSFAGGFGKSSWEVPQLLSRLNIDLYESLTVEIAKGLTIIKKIENSYISTKHLKTKVRISTILHKIERKAIGKLQIQPLVSELSELIHTLSRDLTDYERALEMRYRFLVQSNRTALDQIKRLKDENKRLLELIPKDVH